MIKHTPSRPSKSLPAKAPRKTHEPEPEPIPPQLIRPASPVTGTVTGLKREDVERLLRLLSSTSIKDVVKIFRRLIAALNVTDTEICNALINRSDAQATVDLMENAIHEPKGKNIITTVKKLLLKK
jgi:hypothetical protein